MKSVKWLYVSALAIAFGMLSFGTIACHDDDDDPKPEEGEVIETPKPVVEYYIMGTVTSEGVGKSGVTVNVGDKNCTTDAEGKFSVTESNVGTYEVSVAPVGYLSQKTSVTIADNAENRSVLTVALALTEESPKKEVVLEEMDEPVKIEDSSASNEVIPTKTEDFGQVEPDKVVEDMPLAKVEIEIPKNAIVAENQDEGIVNEGKVEISVTTFVPAPIEVVTETEPTKEEIKENVPLPLAAAQFEPSGLKFAEAVTISIPNPIPGITFPEESMRLTCQNEAGEWVVVKDDETHENVAVSFKDSKYTAPVMHFSAYAIENSVSSKVEKEVVQKDEILGQASRDNSENAKAVTGIVLKYTEKAGWDYVGDIAQTIKNVLGGSVEDATVNAMAAYLKTRMYSLMGSTSNITETERTYNTVNVNGYTEMNYTCYAKTRTTTLTTKVIYNGQTKTISISAKRYTGTDQQYKTVTYNPTHSGGKGGSI